MSQQLINLGSIANDGTGSPLRTGGTAINANFSELYTITTGIINVRNYGAVGDGITDDTAAVQNALTAATGGMCFIPEGTFLINGQNPLGGAGIATLLVPSGTTVLGAGYGSVLKFGWLDGSGGGSKGSCYIRNSNAFASSPYVFDSQLKLLNFRLVGGNSSGLPVGTPATAPAIGIWLRNATDVEVRGLTVTNVGSISLMHQGVSRLRVIGNQFNLLGKDAITGGPYDTSASTDVVIADNEVSSGGDDMIACNASVDPSFPGTTPPQRWVIAGNKLYGSQDTSANNDSRGIFISGASDITVTGNLVSDTWQQSLRVIKDTTSGFSPTRLTITGNEFRRAGAVGADTTRGVGVTVENCTDLKVTGNLICDSALSGMVIGSSSAAAPVSGFEIVGNTIARCGGVAANTFGLWLAGFTAGGTDIKSGLVSSNRVSKSGVGGILAKYVDQVDLVNNVCYDNDQHTGDTTLGAGIVIEGAGNIRVDGNHCYDDQVSKTQTYGLATRVTAITTLTMADNDFTGNLTDNFILSVLPTNLHLRLSAVAQTLTYGSTLTPDPRLGEVIEVTLTGNVTTLNEPPALARYPGVRFTLVFIQDGTGGRTVGGWSANYKQAWSDIGNTLNKRSSITFERDKANAAWTQVGAQSPYV